MRFPRRRNPKPEPVAVTEDDWYALLRMGTRLTLAETLSLAQETREALYRASVRLDADRALQVALLVREGMEAWPHVTKEADDGEGLEGRLAADALVMAGRTIRERIGS